MTKTESIEKLSHEIELDEKLNRQVRGWKIQRIGWITMMIVTLAALLGLCGNGPLSYRTEVLNRDTIQYEFFLRYQGHAEMELHMQQHSGLTRVSLPMQYWKAFKVEKITPEPADSQLHNDTLSYFFKASQKGSILFYLTPNTRGSVEGGVVVNNTVFPIAHFIYP